MFGWGTKQETEIHVTESFIKRRYPDYYSENIIRTRPNSCYRLVQMPAEIKQDGACISLESVNRISKLPMVESTLQTSKHIYDKVKDFNNLTNWTMSTAENTVHKAMEVGKPYATPVLQSLDGPIKKVDGIICSGLDYVEAKVPAVKLPPGELYTSTKDYIANNPTVVTACSVVKPAVDTAKSYVATAGSTVNVTVQGAKTMVEPVFDSAKKAVEPALESARNIVEPYVESSKEKAAAIRDFGAQKIDEYLYTSTPGKEADPTGECTELQKAE